MGLLGKKLSEYTPQDLELVKEAAGALARSGERLEKALACLQEAESLLEKSGHEEREAYRVAWERAAHARHLYIVQREAVGFRNHHFADALFPLPPLCRFRGRTSR